MSTFEQLLDMDDEDDHEFSYSIVHNYFEQAEATFKEMDKALLVYDY
jgi:osomolarity two-component system phosphorelay intermediate protein YPD1